ncbi:MAG TPA: recombinase family protein [Herpetosiphonaceae bacterium]|nr:recombinase family protein [Herpetosiphonaceae bacterium]
MSRLELDKVRRLIRERMIDVLIVYSGDRLTRNDGHAPVLRDEFADAGVDLHYAIRGIVDTTPEGTMFAGVEDSFNRYWRDKIMEAASRGRRGKVEAGVIPGSGAVPYGYTVEGTVPAG